MHLYQEECIVDDAPTSGLQHRPPGRTSRWCWGTSSTSSAPRMASGTRPNDAATIRFAGFRRPGHHSGRTHHRHAAALHDGETSVTRAYGPEARGGFLLPRQLVLDDVPIDYPMVTRPDVLVVISPERPRKKFHRRPRRRRGSRSTGISSTCAGVPWSEQDPATAIAEGLEQPHGRQRRDAGLLLRRDQRRGADESMEAAIKASVKERFIPLNMKAFEAGFSHTRARRHRPWRLSPDRRWQPRRVQA